MNEYISREEFEKRIKLYDTEDHTDKALYNFAHNHMICCPSADVRPNIHGHWKPVDPLQSGDNERYGTYICSVCGTGTYGIVPARWKGCPWCLAIMDVEPKGEKGD